MTDLKLCACGCGAALPSARPNKLMYLPGHRYTGSAEYQAERRKRLRSEQRPLKPSMRSASAESCARVIGGSAGSKGGAQGAKRFFEYAPEPDTLWMERAVERTQYVAAPYIDYIRWPMSAYEAAKQPARFAPEEGF